MPVKITAVHPLDAWYNMRYEFDGLVGMTKGKITQTADEWYGLTFVYRGQEITFMYCQFETATAEK
jgi:hypothetical protein